MTKENKKRPRILNKALLATGVVFGGTAALTGYREPEKVENVIGRSADFIGESVDNITNRIIGPNNRSNIKEQHQEYKATHVSPKMQEEIDRIYTMRYSDNAPKAADLFEVYVSDTLVKFLEDCPPETLKSLPDTMERWHTLNPEKPFEYFTVLHPREGAQSTADQVIEVNEENFPVHTPGGTKVPDTSRLLTIKRGLDERLPGQTFWRDHMGTPHFEYTGKFPLTPTTSMTAKGEPKATPTQATPKGF